jgi:hypothetical protein
MKRALGNSCQLYPFLRSSKMVLDKKKKNPWNDNVE